MTTLTFDTADIPSDHDTIPPGDDVIHPCDTCGRETGWTGRGRRKKQCDSCKPKPTRSTAPKVTGKTSDMAAQAAKVLTSINSVMALGFGGVGYTGTMAAIFDANDDFEQTQYQALLTNPKLCQKILSVGETSSSIAVLLGYIQMSMRIAPVFMTEYRVRKQAREVQLDG